MTTLIIKPTRADRHRFMQHLISQIGEKPMSFNRLEITITQKNGEPMGLVPDHTLPRTFRMLEKGGYWKDKTLQIAICDYTHRIETLIWMSGDKIPVLPERIVPLQKGQSDLFDELFN